MDVTETVRPEATQRDIVDRVVAAAGTVSGGRIKNLILNAHGWPAWFQLGTGLSSSTMAPWSDVSGKVFKIWFRGCLVARIAGAHADRHEDGSTLRALGVTSGNGHAFVRAFARLTRCYVVAPTELQVSRQRTYPHGQMNTYEGLVLSYDPEGTITWRRRYPSVYGFDPDTRRATAPNDE
ncbi:hypothetical protein ABVF61_14030 [Roseibium sp. HPY-6]|uniref:hypothetical protein n=1 Tax=Roseibium sp. HPY-6 TaxID=3229852 RepID=UPI00338D643D